MVLKNPISAEEKMYRDLERLLEAAEKGENLDELVDSVFQSFDELLLATCARCSELECLVRDDCNDKLKQRKKP